MKMNLLALILISGSFASLALPAKALPLEVVPPAKALLITTVTNDEGETLVADFTGRTLYVFDLDQNRPAPICSADCAEVWPPYLLSADEVSALQAPLGSIMRANKSIQLTYKGRPIYTYAYDRAVADDKGDGIGGVWHYIEVK